jgi:hypothetical protein
MNASQYRVALSVLREKTAATVAEGVQAAKGKTVGELLGSARRGIGHVWDATNKGTQAMAEHLEAKGGPKVLSGAIHAAPTIAAAYGGYKALQGLAGWNRDRGMQGGY